MLQMVTLDSGLWRLLMPIAVHVLFWNSIRRWVMTLSHWWRRRNHEHAHVHFFWQQRIRCENYMKELMQQQVKCTRFMNHDVTMVDAGSGMPLQFSPASFQHSSCLRWVWFVALCCESVNLKIIIHGVHFTFTTPGFCASDRQLPANHRPSPLTIVAICRL